MAGSEELSDFVHGAMARGQTEPRIRAALSHAGWSPPEIDDALSRWIAAEDLPPVPCPRPYVSAREGMLYALLMIALVLVCFHVSRLGFMVIDGILPDVAGREAPDPWAMRFSIASIVAFLPLFVWLDRRMTRQVLAAAQPRRSKARRIFASVTVLAAALVLLGDVVAAIYAFLSGDLTLRLGAKLSLVAVTGFLVAACYREDLDG